MFVSALSLKMSAMMSDFVEHSAFEIAEHSGRVYIAACSKRNRIVPLLSRSISRVWVLHSSVRDVEKAVLHNRM